MRVDWACRINEFPDGTQIIKLTHPSKCQTCFCKNGIGEMASFLPGRP